VIRVWEAAIAAEVALVTVVHVTEASYQEVVVTQENVAALVRDAEDRATLAERETQERVSRVEVENAIALAFARGEVEDFIRRIALLKGNLPEVRQAREAAEENSRGLPDVAANAEQRR
jgi:hypothetical protein